MKSSSTALPLLSLLLCLFSVFTSCSEGAKAQQQKALEAAAMEKYRAQPHRFEIRSCKLYYNEQQVVLDSLHKFEKIFGDNYKEGAVGYYYKDLPIEFVIDGCHGEGEPSPCIERLNILMSHKEEYDMSDEFDSVQSLRPVLKGYILFDGVLVDANTRIEDLNQQLEEKGKYTLGTAMGISNSPGISYDEAACPQGQNCIGLTFISFYYYDGKSGGLGPIQTLRYSFGCTR